MPDSRAVVLLLSAALDCACAAALTPVDASLRRQTEHEHAGVRYLRHLPAAYESRPDWPVILFLHGAGERGRDLDVWTETYRRRDLYEWMRHRSSPSPSWRRPG
jgi:poly(3-hydroxybutyrate) depolymerase